MTAVLHLATAALIASLAWGWYRAANTQHASNAWAMHLTLLHIAMKGRASKNGTARMLARMAADRVGEE